MAAVSFYCNETETVPLNDKAKKYNRFRCSQQNKIKMQN